MIIDATAEVAQVVEHGTENAGVDSSSLSLGTINNLGPGLQTGAKKSGSGSVVEHLLAKEGSRVQISSSAPTFKANYPLSPRLRNEI